MGDEAPLDVSVAVDPYDIYSYEYRTIVIAMTRAFVSSLARFVFYSVQTNLSIY